MRVAKRIDPFESSEPLKSAKKVSRYSKGHWTSISVGLIGPPNLQKEGLSQVLANYNYRVVDGPPTLAAAGSDFAAKVQILIVIEPYTEQELPQAVRSLRAESPGLRVILLVDAGNRASLSSILDTPAHAFLCSKIDCRSLLNTIDVVLNGGGVISIDLMSHLLSPAPVGKATLPLGEATPHPAMSLSRPLSHREVEILRCLTGGASNKLIARHFEIAESTVKIHVKGILRKISVQNRTQAAIWALAQVPPIAALETHEAHA